MEEMYAFEMNCVLDIQSESEFQLIVYIKQVPRFLSPSTHYTSPQYEQGTTWSSYPSLCNILVTN